MLFEQIQFQAAAIKIGIGFFLCQHVIGFVDREIVQQHQQHNCILNLIQLYRSNDIRSAYMLIKENSVDAGQLFIQSIAEIEHSVSTFQWRILKLKPTSISQETLPSYTSNRLKIARSLHEWIFVFTDDLEFGREEYELCMSPDIRDFHHIGLVLVVLQNTQRTLTDDQIIIDYLQYVWTHVHPSDLLAIICDKSSERSDCISYRFNPEMNIRKAQNYTENESLFKPAIHAAALRLHHPLTVDPDRFVVKFSLNSVNNFVALDLARDGSERLVGYNVWIAHLFAKMLHKPLHLVLIGMDGVIAHIGNRKISAFLQRDWRVPTRSLLAEDRIDFTLTYAHTFEEYKK